jgi:prepilin-type N-terminal cleavage/methylation domain-containing protein
MARAGCGQGGFSLIEVIVALIITGVIVGVSLQTFAFGAIELEKLGYRRQALALLDGEMEYWRARFEQADSANAVPVAEGLDRDRDVPLDPDHGLTVKVHTDIHSLQREQMPDGGVLHYQIVGVQVTYEKVDLADTLSLESRLYVR